MELPFARSERSTLGLEWELALVDHHTGDLRPVADQVLEACRRAEPSCGPDDDHPYVKQELLTNTVEVITDVCRSVGEGIAQLRQVAGLVEEICRPLGVELYSQGSHPFAAPRQQPVTDKERYAELIRRTQWWGRQMVIYGVHVHVGLERRAYAVPAMNTLTAFHPHFQALTASSPFWSGEDTGYASQRALMFQQLPTAGLPFQLSDWGGFETYVRDMLRTGVIDDVTEVRWDVRPVPRLGTVEMRIADGLATLEEIAAIAALTQCLVHRTVEDLEAGRETPRMPQWYAQENKWRAARYGMEAIIILNADGDEMLVTEHLEKVLEDLAPIAEKLGCDEELAGVRTMMAGEVGYQRQRRVAAAQGGDLRGVVLDSTDLTRRSIRHEL
ncbi:glutamate--cysteine ligase [Nesterenkonia aerolata]|uniref:Putative glutamate--cysteine ligase 2 n=1 Tax=Nesterenkonia aerolata TaxID=3074079 RepID=A0ABU2DTN8_9MICC|nr:glutamate--cysteine ligase [Nesterenkonia sp. LY-0111]MDR8019874.1 glutamate--cysteine ligase [Nesterenkonia sp. LY-0111]